MICALETLEAFAKNNDRENNEIVDLQKSIEILQNEKGQRNREKENIEKVRAIRFDLFHQILFRRWPIWRTTTKKKSTSFV